MDYDAAKVNDLIAKHQGLQKNLIALLLDIQECFNYLPADALRQVARALDMPLIDVLGVATFYRAFSLKPRGKHTCLVCLGTACHVRGGPKILEEVERRLGVPAGENTPDGLFTLETAACLGCCAIGPVVVVDGEYHGHATVRQIGPLLAGAAAGGRKGRRTGAGKRAKAGAGPGPKPKSKPKAAAGKARRPARKK